MAAKIIKVLIPVGVIAVAVVLAGGLMSMRKPPEKKDEQRPSVLITAQPVQAQDLVYRIRSQGTVKPKLETNLSSEVNGRIVEVAENFIEGGFMLGVLSGYWLFSAFMDPAAPQSSGWLQVYWLLALLCAANLALLSSTPFPKLVLPPTQPLRQDFIAMLQLVYKPLVFVFVLSAFLYVLI